MAVSYFRPNGEIQLKNICIISPDAGGVTRAREFALSMNFIGHKNINIGMIIKKRMKG